MITALACCVPRWVYEGSIGDHVLRVMHEITLTCESCGVEWWMRAEDVGDMARMIEQVDGHRCG